MIEETLRTRSRVLVGTWLATAVMNETEELVEEADRADALQAVTDAAVEATARARCAETPLQSRASSSERADATTARAGTDTCGVGDAGAFAGEHAQLHHSRLRCALCVCHLTFDRPDHGDEATWTFCFGLEGGVHWRQAWASKCRRWRVDPAFPKTRCTGMRFLLAGCG